MADIRWTVGVSEDLGHLENWIAKDSPLNAVEFVDRLVVCAEKLADTPLLGRVVPEFSQESLRELIFRGYRLVYSVAGDQITILRVVHGARDLRRLASRESWMFE